MVEKYFPLHFVHFSIIDKIPLIGKNWTKKPEDFQFIAMLNGSTDCNKTPRRIDFSYSRYFNVFWYLSQSSNGVGGTIGCSIYHDWKKFEIIWNACCYLSTGTSQRFSYQINLIQFSGLFSRLFALRSGKARKRKNRYRKYFAFYK